MGIDEKNIPVELDEGEEVIFDEYDEETYELAAAEEGEEIDFSEPDEVAEAEDGPEVG